MRGHAAAVGRRFRLPQAVEAKGPWDTTGA
jgi:hypothetical protein